MTEGIIRLTAAPQEAPAPIRDRDSVWRVQWRVWFAIMLRDMRSRFFGNLFGYVVLLAWPIAHMGVVILIHSFQGTAESYGDNLMAYLTSGFLPVFIFVYMSRFTIYAAALNQPLLAFPIVKPLDLLIGHSLLEVVSACLVAIIFFTVLVAAGFDVEPHHYADAFLAFGATLLLGFGTGVLNGAIALLIRPWLTGYSLIVIIIYLTSGALIPAENMPENVRQILAINPVFHCVEWMHSAFLDVDTVPGPDKVYLMAFAVGSMLLGLVIERFFRGRILATK